MRERLTKWGVGALIVLLCAAAGVVGQVNYYPAGGSTSGTSVLVKASPGTTTTGTSEELLYSLAVPANTLAADGDMIRVIARATTAANANSKILRMEAENCSGASYQNTNATTSSAAVLTSDAILIRTSSTTAVTFGGWTCAAANCSGGLHAQMTGLDWTAAQVVAICGLTGTSAGEITLTHVVAHVTK